MPSPDVPWKWPQFSKNEPGNVWWTGRSERQEKGPTRYASLQRRLSAALNLDPSDPHVIRALAEIALGMTIEIGDFQFTKISDSAVAITDSGGETQFFDLDTGEYYR